LRLVEAPEIPKRNIKNLKGLHPLQGATVANMSPALADELDLDQFLKGVLFLSIKPGSPAYRLGFKKSDFIRTVNGKKTSNVKSLLNLLQKTFKRWRITIQRDGKILDLVINR
jgi:S1-C subfamily serine protease